MRKRFNYGDHPLTEDFKDSLNAAFKDMRKAGLIAKQNFSCCSSCAGYELATEFSEKAAKDPSIQQKVKGTVFYNKQTTSFMKEAKNPDFHMDYGSINCKSGAQTSLSTKEVGEIVVEILKKHGISCEWDGNPGKRIRVFKKLSNLEGTSVPETV